MTRHRSREVVRTLGPATLEAHWEGDTLFVRKLVVPSSCRGQGHGSRLLAAVIAEFGAHRIALAAVPFDGCSLSKSALMAWYRSFGFRLVDRRWSTMARPAGLTAERMRA